jgi:hypothetical protein
MDWKENIGKYVYRIKNDKIKKEMIIEGRETVGLNMGSEIYDKLLPIKIEYRFYNDKWVKEEDVFFTKEDIINSL